MSPLLIIGIVIIIIALLVMLFSHSQSLQRFAVLEFLLILAIAATTLLGLSNARTFMQEQYFSLFSVYVNDVRIYGRDMETNISEDNTVLWKNIGDNLELILEQTLPVTNIDGENVSYLATTVYEKTGTDEYSVKLHRQVGADSMSEKECMEYIVRLAKEAARQGKVICEVTAKGTGVLVYTGTGVISPKYIFLTEIPMESLRATVLQMEKEYVLYGAVLGLVGTLILAIVIAIQGSQLRRLIKGVARVADGREDWRTLGEEQKSFWIESNEIRALKNSLSQIATDMARTNYMKYRVLQGYYRFAPKQIEKIFGKNSILEVEVNDRAHVTGTLAFVAYPEQMRLGEQEYLRKMNREYEELGKKQKEYGGILLSDNSDLTEMQFLFQEETERALHFGIDMVMSRGEAHKEPLFVMLHRTALVCGIAGNEEHTFTYMLSKEMKMLQKYVESFRLAGIRMAVTDTVYELIEKETTSRYIGFLEDEGLTFKVYEILDAYSAKERQGRINTKEKFDRALNLFYQEDYYLGRNLFTEVLKECPDDEVAKWYLFLCEKCLNAEYGKNVSCALFSK